MGRAAGGLTSVNVSETVFNLEVSYAQLAVFDSGLTAPFNDWTVEHVAQGFAWRTGSVSFGTLNTAGPILLKVVRFESFDEGTSLAERIIVVPFTVPERGALEVASIGSSAALDLPPAQYELTFEHGRHRATGMWANLYFRSSEGPVDARILRADAELHPSPVLVMSAEPA